MKFLATLVFAFLMMFVIVPILMASIVVMAFGKLVVDVVEWTLK